MTQNKLAEELSISRNTVTDWIQKGAAPKLDTAYNVVDLLNARAEAQGLEKRWTVEEVWQRRPV
jgi:DNA-binding XRE family transcriptional regulator